MGGFEPIIIEKRGGLYVFSQGPERLLSIPEAVFESFECDSVFPPSWTSRGGNDERCARHVLWNPVSGEFLMGAARETPPRLAERFGSEPFRAYLLATWYPEPIRLYLHPYWNPDSPREPFGIEARRISLAAQRRLFELLDRLRPPSNWLATFNSRDKLVAALEAPETTDETPVRLSLAPPAPLGRPDSEAALEEIVRELAGHCYPTVYGNALAWVEAIGEEDLVQAREILDLHGLNHQMEAYRSH